RQDQARNSEYFHLHTRRDPEPSRGLTGRPAERATSQEMEVDVKHVLPAALSHIDRGAPAGVGEPGIVRELRGDDEEVPGERGIGVRQVVQRRDVRPRADEDVRRRLRLDVGEGEGAVVLVDELRRDLTIADLAEEAVGHADKFTSSPRRVPSSVAPAARLWSAS